MNRIISAIERQKNKIAENVALKAITPEKLKQTHSSLNIPLDEFVLFQDLKGIAMLHGKITQDEAQTIYGYLGESPEHFNAQPLEVKATLTKMFSELLTLKITGKLY